jgi:hypothetical protein
MANVLDRNFDFLTNGTVTAAGLHNLIDETNIYAGLISTQEAKTTVGTGDLLLVADSSSIGSPQIAANRVTVQKLFSDTLTNGTFSGATITNGTIATLNSTTGTIPTLTTGTTTSTNEVVTNGTITNLSATTSTLLGTITGSTNVINIGSGQIYKDASGNVGIGVTSPADTSNFGKALDIRSSTGAAAYFRDSDDASKYGIAGFFGADGNAYYGSYGASTGAVIYTSGTERLRIDSSGNVGIGQSSLTSTLTVNKAGTDTTIQMQEGGVNTAQISSFQSSMYLTVAGANNIIFRPNSTERMRIDSSGNVLVGSASSDFSSGVGIKFNTSATAPKLGIVVNTASDNIYHLYNTNATNNGYRFYVNTDGGISNFSANNVNLSDERLKTNINPSGNYLDKICSIPVKTFNYKDQGEDTEKTIGVLAQEVEAHIPELINNDGFGETPADGIPLKTIYQTDLQYVLMRCIQELSAKVTALEAA